MILFPGPGILAVTGAGFLAQQPAPGATPVESPLPGGIAAVVRFLFNLPSWLQITGAIIGTLLVIALVIVAWRRRQRIITWVQTRPRSTRIALIAAAAAVVILGLTFGTVSWNYMQHDNGFCTGCHVMGSAYVRFTQSEHSQLSCHNCHQQSLYASMRQMYLWIAERPAEIGPHAKVANAVCMKCHVTGEKEVWQRIASTAGHRAHLESHNPALHNVQCVTCHATEVHHFAPLDRTCGQAGCHELNKIALGKMQGQTTLHCTTCHRFTAEVPPLATRDSAAGTLRPGERQCFSCHAMQERLAAMNFDPSRDPHGGTCGMCHNPHIQESPAAARLTCASAACHADWRKVPFHTGATHRKATASCITCHLPHQARVDASDCTGCHEAVRERSRLKPPLPFDTTRVQRRVSAARERPQKVKGDAPPLLDVTSPPDTFSHPRHKSLACITCHVAARSARLTFTPPRGCQLCHHQAAATKNCSRCHTEAPPGQRSVSVSVAVAGHAPRERAVPFDHARHADQRCVACHTTEVTLVANPAVACRSCHEPHHAVGRDCRSCHGAADPKAAHASLADAHVACDNCHVEDVVAQLVPNRTFCQTCHGDRTSHHAGKECTTCHFLAAPEEFRVHLRKVEGA